MLRICRLASRKNSLIIDDFWWGLIGSLESLRALGGENSEGGQGADIAGVYWGLLGALTAFAYWGAREAEGCRELRRASRRNRIKGY